MKIVRWSRLVQEFFKASEEEKTKFGLVVFDSKKSGWRKTSIYVNDKGEEVERKNVYKFEDCCYTFSSNEKYFNSSKFGNSLFASCLRGYDSNGINLDLYLVNDKKGWQIKYAFIFDNENELRLFRASPRKSLAFEIFDALK